MSKSIVIYFTDIDVTGLWMKLKNQIEKHTIYSIHKKSFSPNCEYCLCAKTRITAKNIIA
jgi:hypothetical protein